MAEYQHRPTKPTASRSQQHDERVVPKRTGTRSREHQERGWVRASTTPTNALVHVGSVFFRTKEHALDAQDRSLIVELANAYGGPSATTMSGDGISGEVIGYADPQPSNAPDNETLSATRARNVAQALSNAMRANPPSNGFYEIASRGAGVAPHASAEEEIEGGAEANLLAPYRRADIYIRGVAHERTPTDSTAAPATLEPGEQPPDFSHMSDDIERWLPQVEQGRKDFIQGVARRAFEAAKPTTSYLDSSLRWLGIIGVEPPWWANRAAGLPTGEPHGRGHLKTPEAQRDEKLIADTRLLMRDLKELTHFANAHQRRDLHDWIDASDRRAVREQGLRLGYILFMQDEIARNALDIDRRASQ